METEIKSFDSIKESIIAELSNNTYFKDYNFSATGLNILVDALAYAETYGTLNANFALNESYLQSAQLRSSVVSLAKSIGYFPFQYRAAKATLKLSIEASNTDIAEGDKIPSGTRFIASSSEETYSFETHDNYVWQMTNQGNWEAEIEVVNGTWVTDFFTQDEYFLNRYILSNAKIDTDYTSVEVFKTSTSTTSTPYTYSENLDSMTYRDNVYFMQEAYNGNVEIYFGDGFIGSALSAYNYISVTYLVTDGAPANNIISFALENKIGNSLVSDINVQCIEVSAGGGDKESTESIRQNAPKFYQRQNRNVTFSDYETAVMTKYGGWVESVKAWGGEDNVPPMYGYVFLSIKPYNGLEISPVQEETIISSLESGSIPCVTLKIVSPTVLYVDMEINIDWNTYKTSLSKTELEDLIEQSTFTFFEENVQGFSSMFVYSKYISYIGDLDDAIISIDPILTLKETVTPSIGLNKSYTVEFNNEIENGSLNLAFTENQTLVTRTITDNNGNVVITGTDGTSSNIGTIDYATGTVIFEYNFNISSSDILTMSVRPDTNNVYTQKNFILYPNIMTINMTQKVV